MIGRWPGWAEITAWFILSLELFYNTTLALLDSPEPEPPFTCNAES